MGNKKKKIRVLMCCSALSVKGGMVSVMKNYLQYTKWGEFEIIYVPTHIEKAKPLLVLYFGVAWFKICMLLLLRRIDIAYLHTAERGSFFRKAFLVQTCKKFHIKTIMHHHAAEFEYFYQSLSLKKKQYVKQILENVNLNVVLSSRLVPMILDKAPRAKVTVLYNAVKTSRENQYSLSAKNILFLGRLGERKGIYNLLEVLHNLDRQLPPHAKVYLCGDGELDLVKKKIRDLSLTHRIAHVGWVDGMQKREFMLNSAMHILPSYQEGLPMSILETMSYGIPNISTKIASIPEVIEDKKNGFLISPGNQKELTKAIRELMENPMLREEFSNQSFRLIQEKFSLEEHMRKVKMILHSVLNKAKI
ncbi:polysaccharide biosynthesis protein [Clostridia bacterium]|nr:polysaccharide biosynthesis protein [Clostridia bacterium]